MAAARATGRSPWWRSSACCTGAAVLALAAGLAQAQQPTRAARPAASAARAGPGVSAPATQDVEQLRRHYRDQLAAARRQGDPLQLEKVLREAMAHLPADGRWPNDLAWVMRDANRASEALALWDRAVSLADQPLDLLLYRSNRLAALVSLRRSDAAAAIAQVRQDAERALAEHGSGVDRVRVLRVLGGVATREAELHQQAVRLHEQLAARTEAQRRFAEALDLARGIQPAPRDQIFFAAQSLAVAQRERAYALVRLQRYGEAEQLLDEHLVFIERESLPAVQRAHAQHALASLRLWQGDFAEAERQLRLARRALEDLRVAPGHPWFVGKVRDLVLALWARGQGAEAARELAAFDDLAARAKVDPDRVRLSFERGLVYLTTGRAREAQALFAAAANYNRVHFGPSHFYTAQAAGLQAVARWTSGDPGQRREAADALRAAVLDLLSPANADFLDDANVRRPVRELIFRSYLEAMADRGGLQALVAMGVADRLLSGSAGQAMADAAVRAAAHDPTLAQAVRQEQDLRGQLQAIQEALQADGVEAATAEALRRQATELGLQRQQAQETIRAANPRFERLLNPGVVNPTDVAQRLGRDEVLLLAMPTPQRLYLWAMAADELPVFQRVEVGRQRLQELVQRLRRTLDFGQTGGRTKPFDQDAARELHRHLVAPVQALLRGKRHLIVATHGPLAQVPMSLLLAGEPAGGEPAWLIRQLAISHVPTVSAWLALRQVAPGRQASEPLMGWADPVFAAAPRAPGKARPATRDLPVDERGKPARLRYEDLPPLPETRDELRAIATALKANPERDLRIGAQATRDSVLAASRSGELARKRVIVFATHGLMAGDLPGLDQPALALASTPGRGNELSALIGLDDILGLKLNADWVVLSACNTAAADGKAEESLSGLARGFLYAGSRSLLVTHWAVETESARQLTTATFEHHAANPQASKAESLRQAMLKLMAQPKYAHPAYWAPFALVGDGAR
jgi:CHAT domain-containing protein